MIIDYLPSSGGVDIELDDVSGAVATSYKTTVTLKWSDPSDITVKGVTVTEWSGTKVVRKAGSAPSDVSDGTVVCNNKVRNQYSSSGFEDTGLTYGTTYYYRFFPYSTGGLVTDGTSVSAIPSKVVISIVPSQSGVLTYNGNSQTPSFNNYDSDELTIGGVMSGTNAGTYTATFTPKSDYRWSDDSVSKSVNWSISKATLTVPTVTDTSKTYNGSSQSPTITGFDSTTMTKTGDSATDAGSYTVIFGLVDSDNYQWNSGTTSFAWSIARATSAITLSSSSVTLDGSHLTRTVTVSNVKSRTLSVSTSNSSVATASVSGSTVTISNVNQTTGTATITVTAAQSTNYESATASVAVTCQFGQTYTIRFNMNQSNPAVWGTYEDCTVTELSAGGGENEIDEFMGYYPCMLKNGVEGVRLNPNDYTKDINGNNVDITSGASGDVMIKFPVRGYKISRDGDYLRVSITSKKNEAGYKYLTYDGKNVKAFYQGAYEGDVLNDTLRSLSGKTLTNGKNMSQFRTAAHNAGSNYEQFVFACWTYIQCCALLKYKGKNMQSILGEGYTTADSSHPILSTGTKNSYGLNYGSSNSEAIKLFGMENYWGSSWAWVDGVYVSDNKYYIADDNFNDTGTGYDDSTSTNGTPRVGYTIRPIGTNLAGFLPDMSYVNGSVTTYFCDQIYPYNNECIMFGGNHINGCSGLFNFYERGPKETHATIGARLTYFKTTS